MPADHPHYLGPLTDSARWQTLAIRPGDVFVVTPPKCGTTWMQTIVALLLSGDPDLAPEPATKMPWVDFRLRDQAEVTDRLQALPGRRCLKSHTPMDGVKLDPAAQYLCVFRHPLDAHFSFRNHVRNIPLTVFDDWYPEDDPDGRTFHLFLSGSAQGFECDAMPLAHILRHYSAARARSHLPNVTLFHYADMTRDLPGVFRKVAALLGVSHPPEVMAQLIDAAGFDNMKRRAQDFAPGGGSGFYRSDAEFFHKGGFGQWAGQLTQTQLEAYDAILDAQLSAHDRAWLEFGQSDT